MALSSFMIPVCLSISYLFLLPFGFSMITLSSSGALSPSDKSCHRFIILVLNINYLYKVLFLDFFFCILLFYTLFLFFFRPIFLFCFFCIGFFSILFFLNLRLFL